MLLNISREELDIINSTITYSLQMTVGLMPKETQQEYLKLLIKISSEIKYQES